MAAVERWGAFQVSDMRGLLGLFLKIGLQNTLRETEVTRYSGNYLLFLQN
jgi:hypothetical protein